MRKLSLILSFFLLTVTLNAQVGVGTANPNPSSQLEVVSSDRGILIPRVALQSTTDLTTIANGNINSLMVFNTETINDVEPGYYYWYVDKWYKFANIEDVEETITTLIDEGEGVFIYTSEDGTETVIDIPTTVVTNILNQGDVYNEIIDLIEDNETITVLQYNEDGTYTYYNEDDVDADGTISGIGVTIDVVGDVITDIQNEGDIYNEIVDLIENSMDETLTVLTDNGDGTFTYTDEEGNEVTFDANTTSMMDNGDGTYTLTNDNGETITIDVVGDIITDIQNEGDIYNEIVNLIENEFGGGNVTYNPTENKFYYIDENGDEQEIDWSDLNTTNVSFTLENDNLIVTDSEGNTVELAVEEIANNSTFIDELTQNQEFIDAIANATEGIELVDNGDGSITLINADGDDLGTINKADLADNGDGTYTFDNGNGSPVTIDIPATVVNQFEEIVHGGPVNVDGDTYNIGRA